MRKLGPDFPEYVMLASRGRTSEAQWQADTLEEAEEWCARARRKLRSEGMQVAILMPRIYRGLVVLIRMKGWRFSQQHWRRIRKPMDISLEAIWSLGAPHDLLDS